MESNEELSVRRAAKEFLIGARSKVKGVEDMLGLIVAVLICSLVARVLCLSRPLAWFTSY
jgi:hypothetical protein